MAQTTGSISHELSSECLDFIIDHVFLPPQLPQKAEDSIGEKNSSLLRLLYQTSTFYTHYISLTHNVDSTWRAAEKMLSHFGMLENVTAHAFTKAVSEMNNGDTIGIHITAQNAGLVLGRTGESVVFTSFEASPTSSAVTGTTGKLLISYPGPAVAVPWDKVSDPQFLAPLANFVEKMNRDVLGAAAGRGSKAGETLQEERESAHPMFVTEMLTGILRAVGQEVELPRFTKRIGDEVLWDNAKVPWRRSPLWLVVRVALQIVLGVEQYNRFMVFFMTRVLDLATRRGIEGHRLFVMNAKLARRVYKLRDRLPDFVLENAHIVGERAHGNIEEGWVKAQGRAKRLKWEPWRLVFNEDARITMPGSREYVMGVRYVKCERPKREGFIPNEAERIDITDLHYMPDISQMKGIDEDRKNIMLADFEAWVANRLDQWQRFNIQFPNACNILGERLEDYLATAKEVYQGNPERNSIMVLTTMEMWMALDQMAVRQCPLLSEYSPEFNEAFLSALLLPQAQQRTRLSRIETYIKTRRSSALRTSVSVFSKDTTEATFSVRYFNSSDDLNIVYHQILEDAALARQAKIAQLEKYQEQYDRLQTTIQTSSCQYFTHWLQGWTRHDRNCRKCAMVNTAKSMRIEVHEWPLPEDTLAQAAAVFELRCPAPFAIWRETTFRILTGLFSGAHTQQKEQKPFDTVASYHGLQKYFETDGLTRPSKLNYTSSAKSFLSSHYRLARFPATVADVCVKNALRFELYDTSTRTWTAQRPPDMDIRHMCTFRIPVGPYEPLQYALNRTSHLANRVLARQHECPAELQLHEYIAFGLLRSGRRLQWLNMLRELRSRTLTFSAEAVNMLFLQAAWQVGSPGDDQGERESHVEPGQKEFGKQMILELSAMLKGLEANWQEVVAAQTLIVLAGQILAGTKTAAVEQGAIQFLREARLVCLAWTRELAQKLPECKPGEVRELQLRVVQMAATCRMTFDVEECYLADVLHTAEDVAVLVECASTIRDNAPAIVGALPTAMKTLLERDRRIAYAVEKRLRYLVTSNIRGIDLKPIWSQYEQGTRWMVMAGRNERWVITYTRETAESECQKVHYNLITGELLVEGLPLGRMPVSYTNHTTYKELFGEKVLDVFPCSMPGMIFQTKHPISGHKVAFALHESDLIIRTQREKDGFMQQLIPRSKLFGDFPANIISRHVFWLRLPSNFGIFPGLDHSNGRIDLCEKDTPWTPKNDWYIEQSYDMAKTRFNIGPRCQLLDVRSPTTTMITEIFAALEFPKFIEVSFKDGRINVHLPRLKLDFILNDRNKLECKQFQRMEIDENQSLGTFIGLENLLVVRQGAIRSVIVPYGRVLFVQNGSHTMVEIDTTGLERVKYHIYTVNSILGTLVGNGSLTSHLYKIYLHAVTSHCHPDPLTRRTGTEEALAGLRAAATRSFQTVEADGVDAQLFGLIAALTPVRVYYPTHLKRMQQIKWRPGLSPIAQHDAFYKNVREVAAYAGLLNIFEDVKGSMIWPNAGDEDLAERAAIRNAVFRTEQFGGSMVEKTKDIKYEARDILHRCSDEATVFHVAGLVAAPDVQGRLNIHPMLLETLENLGEIQGASSGDGVSTMQLGYDRMWLEPNFAEVWLTLYDRLRSTMNYGGRYDDYWMFLLSTLAYSGKIDLRLIETLLAFGRSPMFKEIDPPNHPSYKLQDGYEPDPELLSNIIRTCMIEFGESKESKLEGLILETEQQTHERRFALFNNNKELQEKAMVHELLLNWSRDIPDIDDADDYPLIKVPEALLGVRTCFESWNRNCEFRDHIMEVQEVLDIINTNQAPAITFYNFKPCAYTKPSQRNTIRFSDLLTRSPPALPPLPNLQIHQPNNRGPNAGSKPKDASLETLLQDFRGRRANMFRKKYIQGLEESIDAFQRQIAPPDTADIALVLHMAERIKALRTIAKDYLWNVFRAIEARLAPLHLRGSFMSSKAGLWPRVSPMLLLQQLATNNADRLSSEWQAVLVTYGIAITVVQRLERLSRLAPSNMRDRISSDFLKELENTGHQNWEPLQRPDWLLIEIENNFLIRPVQADIANSMITPPDNHNSIMQLCMGEGKTSVIVPIVAAALADATRLVRVVVLKPLSGQMFQTLVQKLGGLVNRRIFFMPFSRGITMGKEEITMVRQLYEDCMRSGGILMVQPEHLLSFKLLGLEWLYNSKHRMQQKVSAVGSRDKSNEEVAQLLLDTQRWLDKYSRDILDESDEILNVRHELIYTIGNPAPIQNHPDRWVIIQEIFDLIQEHFKGLDVSARDFEVETHEQAGRFGSIRILNHEAGRKLLRDIALKIIEDRLLTVSFRLFPADKRELATKFIIDTDMTEKEAGPLLKYFGENKLSSGILYLLRGLIAHNIILFSLTEKRWKVDYGLDLKRSLLAVPYRAKDSPAGKAEFSHPDVALTLTCLSYYYGGLNETQLETSFRNLYKSDNPALEYERWIKGVSLPKPYLRRLHGINLEDKKQWKEVIYPTFNFNKAVIDSYLSGVVFPKEAKEFPHKLSTSGWDIAQSKVHPTTGFSGTNDNRYLLPLSINQLDTDAQLNTNARVLSYLLQGENSYMCIAGRNNERIGVEELLRILAKYPGGKQVQVLLDVGAQVLELRNDEVAKTWLDLVSESTAQAAVYFNDNDELTVLTRDGNTEPLMVSAFAERLGSCLVYLDEAHTRGTDLKLPIKSRAAVTLGPNLTKDRLVQACMRMRKLGSGHSVLFCGPPEIDRKIMEIAKANNRDSIEVRDVLYWSMEETCKNTRKILPIWVKQGISYQKHLNAWNDIGNGKKFPKSLLEKESKTLQEHYGFGRSRDETVDSYRKLGEKIEGLNKILEKCADFGVQTFRGAKMLEEQERELAHEVESERENQRPPRVEPVKPHLSDEIVEFIATGTLQQTYHRRSTKIVPAFSVLERTSANEHLQPNAFSRGLLATSDFCDVIEKGRLKNDTTDDFLRPVNWIISSTVDRNILIILSSFEVNRLLPQIRESSHVILHMYSPQVTRTAPSYELLDFCPIPRLPQTWQPNVALVDQLNVFAGQLYFRNYKAYKRVCGFLGLCLDETSPEKRALIRSDGFVDKSDRLALGMKYDSPFVKSPVTLLRALIGFRRKGQSYIATHMGSVLHGRLLTEGDFEMVELEDEFGGLSV